jgi:hypothetical protein
MQAPYDTAIFFDNDADHIKDVYDACVHDSMVAVKVTDAPRGYRLREQTMDSPLMDEYILDNIAPDNTYVEYLRKHGGKMEYDPFSGFNVSGEKDSDMYKLTQWIMKTRPSRNTVPRGRSPSTERSSVDGRGRRCVILDWDRTITVMEGLILPDGGSLASMKGVDPEDILLYLCGGYERLRSLRSIFRTLKRHGIDLMILTNNPLGITPAFMELAHALTQGWKIEIGASYYPPWDGNKAMYLKADDRFSQVLCSDPLDSISAQLRGVLRKMNTNAGVARNTRRRKRLSRRVRR